jgi:hypothetical protein
MISTYHSYEDMGWNSSVPAPVSDLIEGWSPPKIVRWHEMIGFKLKDLIKKAEADRTPEYQKLLTDFETSWYGTPITADMNIETLTNLANQARLLADMSWPQASYFQGLVASLKELEAWQSTKNTMPEDPNANMNMVGGAGASMPPLDPDFGPQDKEPDAAPGEEPGEGELPGEELPGAPGTPAPAGTPAPSKPPRPARPGAPLPA